MLRTLARSLRLSALSLAAATLVACGGGDAPTTQQPQPLPRINLVPGSLAAIEAQQVTQGPDTTVDAARFLTQATFGPTPASVAELRSMGYEAWVVQQLRLQPAQTHENAWLVRDAELKMNGGTASANVTDINHSFWRQALTGNDQLRQRVAFALSQIFVVSSMDGCGDDNARGLAHYYDTLVAHAFGSYRDLLESVARHPIMGCYLSHLRNQKENALTGRVPDENFAREVMQLFSIGLYELNPDGTQKLADNGQPLETYTADDVAGLAKVFTGFSFDCPTKYSDECFLYGGGGNNRYADRWARPMVGYAQFHSAGPKTFLGVAVPAQTPANPDASLAMALNRLGTLHPNVGPFIGKQLIQRLVTSNPSPAYVLRVTQAFEASGRNMGAMVRAILLDPEARDNSVLEGNRTFGKAREPVLKLSAFLRAVGTQSETGRYLVDHTDNAGTALGQSPLRALSVFNFYRPGYVHAGGASAAAGLVAPELQIANETSAAGYVNYMMDVIRYGAGRSGYNWSASRRDIQLGYATDPQSPWLLAAMKPDATELMALLDQRLFYSTMPAALKQEIKTAVEGVRLKATPTVADTETKTRLWSALLLAVASPEFQVQR